MRCAVRQRRADREEVVITRAGHDPVVIVSLEDYESLKETAYLLRSPANARRLLASIDELENGGSAVRELATEDAYSPTPPGTTAGNGGGRDARCGTG
ncbi:type II toxin-antitoxin system prevent-host-death family antitoxin [Streptomyces sp. NPDC005492]|uniref:type II toxin-antitoxin system Phd/YefM family antitoxin n=1 Tax=Streptomyces sp. NPDC005492 TaxID=3156883 RepID=UPI0033AE77FC